MKLSSQIIFLFLLVLVLVLVVDAGNGHSKPSRSKGRSTSPHGHSHRSKRGSRKTRKSSTKSRKTAAPAGAPQREGLRKAIREATNKLKSMGEQVNDMIPKLDEMVKKLKENMPTTLSPIWNNLLPQAPAAPQTPMPAQQFQQQYTNVVPGMPQQPTPGATATSPTAKAIERLKKEIEDFDNKIPKNVARHIEGASVDPANTKKRVMVKCDNEKEAQIVERLFEGADVDAKVHTVHIAENNFEHGVKALHNEVKGMVDQLESLKSKETDQTKKQEIEAMLKKQKGILGKIDEVKNKAEGFKEPAKPASGAAAPEKDEAEELKKKNDDKFTKEILGAIKTGDAEVAPTELKPPQTEKVAKFTLKDKDLFPKFKALFPKASQTEPPTEFAYILKAEYEAEMEKLEKELKADLAIAEKHEKDAAKTADMAKIKVNLQEFVTAVDDKKKLAFT